MRHRVARMGLRLTCAFALGLGAAGGASAQTTLSCDAVYGINTAAGVGTLRRLQAPYTDGASTVLVASTGLANVNALGVNPTDLTKAYYFDTSSPPTLPATDTLYYVDLALATPTAGHLASPTFQVPFGASDTLAFGPDGLAYAYDDVTGVLYRQGTAPITFGALLGGLAGAALTDYLTSDILVDASGMVYVVGLYPRGAVASAHLIRLDPATGRAAYVRALALTPSTPFPAGSSGLAFAPGSTDAAPLLLWSPTTGIYTIDVLAGTAVRATSTSRADLGSCPRTTVARRVTLGKVWAGALGSESATLQLSAGGAGALIAPVNGSSSAGGTTTPASAGAFPGSVVTLTESLSGASASDFRSTLACRRLTDGVLLDTSAGTVAVPSDSDVQCAFTNRRRPRLTLRKQVQDLPGVIPPDAAAWTLSASLGATTVSGVNGAAAVTGAVVDEGNWSLGESGGVPGYVLDGWACTGATLTGSDVALDAGADAICTATNRREVAALLVNKQALGEPPASAPWSFSLSAEPSGCLASPQTQTIAPTGGTVDFTGLPTHSPEGAPCSYTLSEAATAGWQLDAAASDAMGQLVLDAAGDPVTVRVVNRRVVPPPGGPVPVPTLPAWPLATLLVMLAAGWRRLTRGRQAR